MKVAVIAFNNICFSPYIFTYTQILEDMKVEGHLIYLNRQNIEEDFEKKNFALPWNKKKNKILNFLSFVKRTKKILRKEKYDFVFVLTTIPAVLLSGFLLRNYKGKYLVDIRDYTYEHNKLFYYLESKVIKNATMVTISSPGFVHFLPPGNISLCHNMSSFYRNSPYKIQKTNKMIVIGYVGTIAYIEYCKKLIDLVAQDERFAFHFYGNEINEDNLIKKYVEEINNSRILYFGAYKAEEKRSIITRLDILFNIYGNDRKLVKYALSNKLYDSFYFKKPILVSSNTAMQDESSVLGYAMDLDNKNALDDLYEWYHNINGNDCDKYADAYIAKVLQENNIFKEKILGLLKEREK